MEKFKGLGVAMVTPFKSTGEIDFTALEKLTEFLINGGVDYLVVQGTTGESPVLSHEEKQAILDTVIKINASRIPVVFGIGGNNTIAVAKEFETYNLTGVDGILSASPYYNKPSQEGIYQHYKLLVNATDLPIIVYNVPGRTASNILPETTLRLAHDFDQIIGVKEASGNIEQIMEIIREKPAGFLVISGDDGLTLPILAAGGDGVISVVGNAFPKPFKEMIIAVEKNNLALAQAKHYLVYPIINHLFAEGNPAGIKACLKEIGIMENYVRLPLTNVSEMRKGILIEHTKRINSH